MRLCHIVPSLEEQHGGPSKSVRSLCAALTRGGDDVDLLATGPDVGPGGATNAPGNLRVRVFQRDWPQRLCPSSGLRDAVAQTDAEIVHHHSIWLRTLHYAHRRTRRGGARLIISPRGMMSAWAWQHRGWRKQLARALIHPGAFEGAAGWHATSDDEAREIRDLGFRQPVCVSPNGVDEPTADSLVAAAAHWHSACPATRSRPVALFYSRFHQKKRLLELIDLWIERGPKEWLLLLVGIPQDYTAEALEDYVRKLSGGGRVAAFSGAGRPPPYAVASLFLLPSHNENFGLVIAEAMAHGVPVVVTDTTPWSAVNAPGLGWCVPWDKYPGALESAVAEGAERLRERGTRAREWVLREFSWERAARGLREFYSTLRGSG